jgi:hypothetical protein
MFFKKIKNKYSVYKLKKELELNLTNKLKNYAKENNILIEYKNYFNGWGILGRNLLLYDLDDKKYMTVKIQVLRFCKNNPYVLAHEIGHWVSIKSKGDISEKSADKKANEICRKLLTKKERIYLGFPIKNYCIYLGKRYFSLLIYIFKKLNIEYSFENR